VSEPEQYAGQTLPAPKERALEIDLAQADAPPEADPEWIGLLNYLLNARGFDFRGYKPSSLARRIRKRMNAVGTSSFAAYQDYLEAHSAEFTTLFNTILINVTGFFRDPPAWEAVRTQVIPQIVASKPSSEPIRAWSAGCATGEEAFTIAMILAEELGLEQFREQVKIYATDVDEEALNAARYAGYTDRQVEGVPSELLSKYFEPADGLYFFRKDLRRNLTFGRHDLINDAPISRIDLLTCRNTLMYLNAETQAQVMARLHFALNDGGFLLLGRAETLMTRGNAFSPVDLKRRLSRKNSRGSQRDFYLRESHTVPTSSSLEGHFHGALEVSPIAQLVVDAAGTVTLINERARTLFGVRPGEVGRPLRDLQLSYRPVDLRSLIEQAEIERRAMAVKDIEWRTDTGESRWLDLHVGPMAGPSGEALGTIITFTDTTVYHRLARESEVSRRELEAAYEELQSTKRSC
jgi:two-component system, chemotaxis family, CheB/CheR fusion protein